MIPTLAQCDVIKSIKRECFILNIKTLARNSVITAL